MRIALSPSHTQATLPGGTNVNWGSQAAAAAGGVGGSQGAYDPSLPSKYYRPAGPIGGMPPTGAPGMPPTGGMPTGGMPAGTPPLIVPTGPSANTSPGLTPGLPQPGSVPTGGPLGTGFPNAMTSPSYAPETPST